MKKISKKALIILIISLLLIAAILTAVILLTQKNPLVGEYTVTSYTSNNEDYKTLETSKAIFKKDGTFTLNLDATSSTQSFTGTWEEVDGDFDGLSHYYEGTLNSVDSNTNASVTFGISDSNSSSLCIYDQTNNLFIFLTKNN